MHFCEICGEPALFETRIPFPIETELFFCSEDPGLGDTIKEQFISEYFCSKECIDLYNAGKKYKDFKYFEKLPLSHEACGTPWKYMGKTRDGYQAVCPKCLVYLQFSEPECEQMQLKKKHDTIRAVMKGLRI